MYTQFMRNFCLKFLIIQKINIDIFYFMIYNIFVKNKVIHNKTK